MKKYNFLILSFIIIAGIIGCQQKAPDSQKQAIEKKLESTGNFGEMITQEEAILASNLDGLFTDHDTVAAKLSGHIKASCKHTGCWMDLDMNGKDVLHVTFKNDGFTIPLDAAGKDAIVKGIAYRELIPVETLRNYAREDGKSKDEINAITQPEWEYDFIADGVIIQD